MTQIALILSAIYVLIIVYVYICYNQDAKSTEKYDFYRDELEILPTEAAYLLNEKANSMHLLLADILSLVNMGYINLELIYIDENNKDYKFTKVKNKDISWLKNHQVLAYRMFFSNSDSMTFHQFFNDIRTNNDFNTVTEVKYNTIKSAINKEFEKDGIINVRAKTILSKINSNAIRLIFLFAFGSILSIAYAITEGPTLLISMIVFLLLSIILYFSTIPTENKLTPYGANLKEKALGTFNYLQEYIIIDDKPLYMVNVLEYYYTCAIAMGLVDIVNENFSRNYIYANMSNKLWR